MEPYFREVGLQALDDPGCLGEVDEVPVLVPGDAVPPVLAELLDHLRIFGGEPAGLVDVHAVEAALGVVLMFQPVLDHVELELAHGAHDPSISLLLGEELGHTLVGELFDALGKLLGLARVQIHELLEDLRRKGRDALELKVLALGQGVADLEVPGIVQADHVAGEGLVDDALPLS